MNEDGAGRLVREALRIEEDAMYSSRGHFESARTWSHVHYWIGTPTAIFAAIAGASALRDQPIAAGLLALLAAGFAAAMTFLNPASRAQKHQTAGNRYAALRNRTRILREVQAPAQASHDVCVSQLRELSSARDELNDASPQILRRAYQRAKSGIESGEATHRVDAGKQGGGEDGLRT